MLPDLDTVDWSSYELPSKLTLTVGDPIQIDGYPPESEQEPAALQQLYRRVTGSMQEIMDQVAAKRRFPVLG